MNDFSDLGRLLEIIEEVGRDVRPVQLGSFDADSIRITGRPAFVYASGGNDTLTGSARGGDELGGGPGSDIVLGRGGDDIIVGGKADDRLAGATGSDTIEGGAGDDTLLGSRSADDLSGGGGDDRLLGGRGDDRITPGSGNDFVNGGKGTDTVVVDGLFSDYVVRERANATILEARDGSGRVVLKDVEFVEDSSGETVVPNATTTLQLLHASDLEGNADAVVNAPNFAAIVEEFRADYDTTLVISAGDNYIPSPFSNAAGSNDADVQAELSAALNDVVSRITGETYESLQSEPGRFDIAIMNAIGFDASALGNHEFDFGQQQVLDNIGAQPGDARGTADDTWIGTLFPYLSANLEFEPESVLQPILDEDGVQAGESGDGAIAPYAIIEENGERFGVIGATTQLLEQLTSVGGDPDNPNDDVNAPSDSNDMAALAEVIQPIVDEIEAQGVNKIILTSHLQQIGLEQQLSTLLSGVDIYIAGGSDTRLADDTDTLREGEEAEGPYPILSTDAGGNDVAIVSTDGQYKYVGRLVAEFDAAGNLIPSSIDPGVSGAYATDEAGVLAVTGAADVASAVDASDAGSQVRDLVNVIQTAVLDTSGSNFLGEVDVDLNGERAFGVRSEETNLGNLTADANLSITNELSDEPVLVSIKNGGGIRATIENDDGLISELEIQEALAFNNGLTLITLSPEQLYQVLDNAVKATRFDPATGEPASDGAGGFAVGGGFPQVGGLRFSFSVAADGTPTVQDIVLAGAGDGGTDVKIYEDATPTEAAADFPGIRTVSLNFLVDSGGDGYPFPDFVAADPDFADVEDITSDQIVADGAARFTFVGSEQDALGEYLADTFPVDGTDGNEFDMADTPASEDMRIVNLAVPGVSDLEVGP